MNSEQVKGRRQIKPNPKYHSSSGSPPPPKRQRKRDTPLAVAVPVITRSGRTVKPANRYTPSSSAETESKASPKDLEPDTRGLTDDSTTPADDLLPHADFIRQHHTYLSDLSLKQCPSCHETWFPMQKKVNKKIQSQHPDDCNDCVRNPKRREEFSEFNQTNPFILQCYWNHQLNRLPRMSLNGREEEVFHIATLAEKQMICVVSIFLHVFRRRKVSGAVHFSRGHMIAFPSDHPALLPVLQLPRTTLPFLYVRVQTEDIAKKTIREFKIRRQVIILLLTFLRDSENPLYRDQVYIDPKRVHDLPEDGFIEALVLEADADEPSTEKLLEHFSQSSQSSQPSQSNSSSSFIDECDIDVAIRSEMTMSLQETAPCTSDSFSHDKLSSLLKVQFDSSKRSDIPMSFSNPAILLGAFPYLFITVAGLPIAERPGGEEAGPSNCYPKRRCPVSFQAQVCHLLKICYRTAQGVLCYPFQIPSFVFFARTLISREYLRRNVRYFSEKDLGDMTVGELRQMIQEKSPVTRIESFIHKSMATLAGSQSYWRKRRSELWEIARQSEHINTFFTFGIADLHHPVLLNFLGISSTTSVYERGLHLSRAPGVVDAFFEILSSHLIDVFLKQIGFQWSWSRVEWQERGVAHRHGLGDYLPFRLGSELQACLMAFIARPLLAGDDPPLNTPRELIQSLRSLERHELEEIIHNGRSAERKICCVIDGNISACNPLVSGSDAEDRLDSLITMRLEWKKSTSAAEKAQLKETYAKALADYNVHILDLTNLAHKAYQFEAGDVDIVTDVLNRIKEAGLSELHKSIKKLTVRSMVHTCSKQYCRAKGSCRFGYPQQLWKSTKLTLSFDQDGEAKFSISFRRNDQYMHPRCSVLLLAAGANCDLSPILDRNAVLAYIIKYVSKREPSEEQILRTILSPPSPNVPLEDPIEKSAARIKTRIHSESFLSVSSAMQSIVSTLCMSRTVSISEAIHLILGLPLYRTSLRFIKVPCETKGSEVDLEGDFAQLAIRKNLWDKYRKRPASEEAFNANDFFMSILAQGTTTSSNKIIFFNTFASMKSPPETSSAYVRWAMWFMIRWIPWRGAPGKYFLKRYASDPLMSALTAPSVIDVDDLSNVEVQMFWKGLILIVRRELPILYNKVTVSSSMVMKVKSRKFPQFGRHQDAHRDEGNEADSLSQTFGENLLPDDDSELPNLAQTPHAALGNTEQGRCLAHLLLQNPQDYAKLVEIIAGNKFFQHLKKSGCHPPAIGASVFRGSTLHEVQQIAVDKILGRDIGTHEKGTDSNIRTVLVLGQAGTGKSLVIQTIVSDRDIVSKITATTGTAAFLIRGTTISSLLRLFNRDNFEGKALEACRTTFANVDILVIDEVGMLSESDLNLCFQRLELVLQGKKLTLALFGDFSQCPPVGGRPLYQHPLFDTFDVVVLTKIFRQTDPIFQKILSEIATGTLTEESSLYLFEKTGELYQPERYERFLAENVIHLAATNREVDEINIDCLKKLSLKTGQAIVKVPFFKNERRMDRAQYFTTGAPIVIEKNLSVPFGFTNGAEGVCGPAIYSASLDTHDLPSMRQPAAVLVQCARRSDPGWLEYVRSSFGILNDAFYDVLKGWVPISPETTEEDQKWCTRLPLRLGWAKTIHKAQGQSMPRAVLRLPKRDPSNLIYVAISRLTTLDGLVLLNLPSLTPHSLVSTVNSPSTSRTTISTIMQTIQDPESKSGPHKYPTKKTAKPQRKLMLDKPSHENSAKLNLSIERLSLSPFAADVPNFWLSGSPNYISD